MRPVTTPFQARAGSNPRARVRWRGGAASARALASLHDVNRFFKSAAFPIVVVILLAFLAQHMMFSGGSSSGQKRDWTTMQTDLDRGQVQALKHNARENSVQVTLAAPAGDNGDKYTVGIPGSPRA